MLFDWCKDTLTFYRAPLKGERGSEVYDWENATHHTIEGCSVQPSSSVRDFAGREDSTTFKLHVFMPPNANILPGDRVKCSNTGEQLFEIDGVPYNRQSPTARVDSTQVDLVVWRG